MEEFSLEQLFIMQVQQAHNEFTQSRAIREEMKRPCSEISCRENQNLDT